MNSFIQWHDHEMFPVVVENRRSSDQEVETRRSSDQEVENRRSSDQEKFGILHIDIPQVPMYKGTIVILFDIDKSGSMNDMCSDSSTKIQHIRHALKNFLSVLIQTTKNHPDITVRIGLCVFSHDAHNLFHLITDTNSALSCDEFGFITIHSDNIHAIYTKIDDIEPWGLTNIEKSLIYTQRCLREYHDVNPDQRLIHIQFTDGDATVGKKKYQELMEFVDDKYKHIFIGVGDEHDSYLLTNISQNTSLGEYRFIDQLDHAGLICGEILYDILFPYAFCDDPIHLIAGDGVKIYDWRINQWTSTLLIPPFSGNRSKDFQLRFESESGQDRDDIMIDIYSKTTRLDTAMVLPQLMNHVDNTLLPNDLTQFILKQYTQEYLYEAIQYELTFRADMPVLLRDDFVGTRLQRSTAMDMDMDMEPVGIGRILEKHIRDKLTHFHTILQRYQERYLDDESFKKFVQVLKDDIRITLKNLGTQFGYLYSTTRQTSQGHQYSYTPTGEENISLDETADYPGNLERNITSYTNPDILDMMTQVQDTVRYGDDMSPSPPNLRLTSLSEYVVYDDDASTTLASPTSASSSDATVLRTSASQSNLPTPIRRNSSMNTFGF